MAEQLDKQIYEQEFNKKIKKIMPDENDEAVYENLRKYTESSLLQILNGDQTIQQLDEDLKDFFSEEEQDVRRKLMRWVQDVYENIQQKQAQKKKREKSQQEALLSKRRREEKEDIQNNLDNDQSDDEEYAREQQQYNEYQQKMKQQQQEQIKQNEQTKKGTSILERININKQKPGQKKISLIQNNNNNNSNNNQAALSKPKQKEMNKFQGKIQQQQNQVIAQQKKTVNTDNQTNSNQDQNTEQTVEGDQNQQQKIKQAQDAKLKVKCKFYPECTKQDCPYHHPKEECTYFPKCTFGSACLNIHPPCSYGANCTRHNCFYEHQPGQKKFANQYPMMFMQPPHMNKFGGKPYPGKPAYPGFGRGRGYMGKPAGAALNKQQQQPPAGGEESQNTATENNNTKSNTVEEPATVGQEVQEQDI